MPAKSRKKKTAEDYASLWEYVVEIMRKQEIIDARFSVNGRQSKVTLLYRKKPRNISEARFRGENNGIDYFDLQCTDFEEADVGYAWRHSGHGRRWGMTLRASDHEDILPLIEQVFGSIARGWARRAQCLYNIRQAEERQGRLRLYLKDVEKIK